MIFAGTGKNLSEASKPCYLETKNGRVAMIAVSSSFHESGMAGGQSAELIGRPGLNPLRYETITMSQKRIIRKQKNWRRLQRSTQRWSGL